MVEATFRNGNRARTMSVSAPLDKVRPMNLFFFEATNGTNWGKFAVGLFTDLEWGVRAEVDSGPLVAGRGWTRDHLLFLDLQTGEGAMLRPGGSVAADLDKHAIWLCPMAEPFLRWLYRELAHSEPRATRLVYLAANQRCVTLTEEEAPSALRGYRRPGVPGRVAALQEAVRTRRRARSALNLDREATAVAALIAALEQEE